MLFKSIVFIIGTYFSFCIYLTLSSAKVIASHEKLFAFFDNVIDNHKIWGITLVSIGTAYLTYLWLGLV